MNNSENMVISKAQYNQLMNALKGRHQNDVIVQGGNIGILAAGNKPIPVAIQRALPQLNAANFKVQDFNKYLMQPGNIYDKLPYPAAGQTQPFTFFQRAQGSTGVSFEDTNMPQAGNLGNNNVFVATGVRVDLISGLNPVQTGTDTALAGAAGTNIPNDFYAVMKRGQFKFSVNNVDQFYNGIAPLKYVADDRQLAISGGLATGNAAADIALGVGVQGRGFEFRETPIALIGGTSFAATVQFASNVALPSGNTTSFLSCILDGFWLRPAG